METEFTSGTSVLMYQTVPHHTSGYNLHSHHQGRKRPFNESATWAVIVCEGEISVAACRTCSGLQFIRQALHVATVIIRQRADRNNSSCAGLASHSVTTASSTRQRWPTCLYGIYRKEKKKKILSQTRISFFIRLSFKCYISSFVSW
jgi:hypothetical protein